MTSPKESLIIGAILYKDFELLDLYGPLEMFGNLKPRVEIVTQQSDQVVWVPKARWVEDGPIFTASGVSAGIDMSLAVIASLFGSNKAMEIANTTEYVWNQDSEEDPFHQYLNMAIPNN